MTPEERAAKVIEAVSGLADSIAAAIESLEANGPTDERTLEAWGEVERAGAVVHRQSRLLAGKPKGG